MRRSRYPAPIEVRPSVRAGAFDPGHHRAEFLADLFDRMIGVLLAHRKEAGATGLVLEDPLSREGAVLDFIQDRSHLGFDPLVDHARAAAVVAVLPGVADRGAPGG